MTTEHFVVKAIDVIPGGSVSRAQLMAMTEEGVLVNLYLPERVEAGLRADIITHLRVRPLVTAYAVLAKGGALVAGPYRTFAEASRILADTLAEQADYASPNVLGWHIDTMEANTVFNLDEKQWEAA